MFQVARDQGIRIRGNEDLGEHDIVWVGIAFCG